MKENDNGNSVAGSACIKLVKGLGAWYKQQREANGKTQKEVCDLSGVSLPTVKRFEGGYVDNITVKNLYALLAAIGKADVMEGMLVPKPAPQEMEIFPSHIDVILLSKINDIIRTHIPSDAEVWLRIINNVYLFYIRLNVTHVTYENRLSSSIFKELDSQFNISTYVLCYSTLDWEELAISKFDILIKGARQS